MQKVVLVYAMLYHFAHISFEKKIKNGILLPKLFWPTMRKNCSSDQEKLKAENLENVWDH